MALRNFRTSWVDLGGMLKSVALGGDYREWGYEDFETYCARELGLKKPTVRKLMVSYNYMKSYHPERLEAADRGGATVPDYTTVELLSRARLNTDVDQEQVREVDARIMSGDEDGPDANRKIRELIRAPQQTVGPAFERAEECAEIIRAARALRKNIAHSKAVPEGLKERTEQLLVEYEALD